MIGPVDLRLECLVIMKLELNDIELRVLGVLIEKQHTTPDAYPLTINALVSGCNQKQNRDPVMSVADGDIARALRTLEHKGLAHQAPPEPGARANRFKHTVVEALHWDKREQAVMCELMLRGRQTAGELRSRASRMATFADLPAVLTTLSELSSHEPPFVEELPREPGRSANRFRHLIGAEGDVAAPATAEAAVATGMSTTPTGTPVAEPAVGGNPGTDGGFADRLAALEARVAKLERRLGPANESDEANTPADSIDRFGTNSV